MLKSSTFLIILYFRWHYGVAFKDISRVFLNYIWFLYHFFSIRLLLSTLFLPWQRLQDPGGKGVEKFLGKIFINTIMRLVGFLARTFIICIGIASIIFTSVLGILFLIVWIFVPAFPVALFIFGLVSLTL
ncbi:MAG: hypothetical protein COV70_02835 [Parcubacteria group bacterium CG11_big_fil_rev_8_21_14_0_20_39_22]|nr:MAG: hypothetical protein COV70_02835 [Parcubacteria group bacterium CG11_big_fil_rev_8_21_14_0_20_39_22]